MRHARAAALDELEDILTALRDHEKLRERKRGIFYRKSAAFLHFHEDPAGLFADLHVGSAFERFPVSTSGERRALRSRVARLLG